MANLDERKEEIVNLISKAQEAVEKGDLETARNLKADIDAQKKEYEELEQLSKEIEASAPKQDEPPKDEGAEVEDNKDDNSGEESENESSDEPEETSDEEKLDDKPEDAPEEPTIEKVEEPTEELEEEKEKNKREGAKRSMAKLNQNPETNEEVLAFEQYMKTKGAKRDNVKSDDVGVTIPEDIKYLSLIHI